MGSAHTARAKFGTSILLLMILKNDGHLTGSVTSTKDSNHRRDLVLLIYFARGWS
jgi:hypothetical protein